MDKFHKNLTRDDWEKANNTKNEQREQLTESVVDDLRLGRFSALIKHEKIDEYLPELKKKYPDIKNIAVKIFFKDKWGGIDIQETSIIQNIFAFKGLAPRVYNLIKIYDDNREFMVQITEDLGEYEEVEKDVLQNWYKDNILKVAEENNISTKVNDIKSSNIVNGKWIDFQGFHFSDKDKAEDALRAFSKTYQTWQGNTYQTIDRLGVKGVRNDSRMEMFDISYQGKRVIDLGCSGGNVCNKASAYAADWVVGIDLPEVVEAAKYTSNYLGHFNTEYYDYNLADPQLDLSHLGKFDILFHLSMYQHIGLQPYIEQLMHQDSILYFEGNPYKSVALLRPELEAAFNQRFSRVEYLGHSNDFGARPLYKLQL